MRVISVVGESEILRGFRHSCW